MPARYACQLHGNKFRRPRSTASSNELISRTDPTGIDDTADGFAQFIGSWSDQSSLDSTSARFDHVINNKSKLFFRFSDTDSTSRSRVPQRTAVDATNSFVLRSYTAGVDRMLSSHFNNQFRLNYSSNEATTDSVIDGLGGNTPVDLRQLVGLSSATEAFVGFIYGGYNVLNLDATTAGAVKQWNLVDSASFSSGRHEFKFGTDYRRIASFALQPPFVAYLYFNKSAVLTNTTSYFAATNQANAHPLFRNISVFAQDQWKASQRLNLNLGLRWDVNPAPGTTQGLKPYTIQFQGSGPNTWTLAPEGTPLWKTAWYNFAPRLGFAYILHDSVGLETVLRGGAGVFFDTAQQLGAGGFTFAGFQATGPPCTSCSFPGNPITFPGIVNPPVPPYEGVYGFPTHLQLPYTLQWNASVEQALGGAQTLSISYVASHASRLLRQSYFTTTNPNFVPGAAIVLTSNGLTSDYDSLQAQFRRRLSRGLTSLASYTWSHCLDYGSQNYALNAGTGTVFDTYERGNCDFDVRHSLSAGFSYDLPNGGRERLLNVLLHHWGVDGRITARTAFPVTLVGNTIVNPATLQEFNGGLNLVSGQPIYLYGTNCAAVLRDLGDLNPGQTCPGGRAINPDAFTAVGAGLGDAPRNFARGFGAWQMNSAVRREFPIREKLALQFRAEAFNIFNHPNFGSINPNFGQSTFGQATATLAHSLASLTRYTKRADRGRCSSL